MTKSQIKAVLRKVEALFSRLPPRTEDRLWLIIAYLSGMRDRKGRKRRNAKVDLSFPRANVVQERRRNGRTYWRLYREEGSRYSGNLKRERIYIGREGGPELRDALRLLRELFYTKLGEDWGLGPCSSQRELFYKLKAGVAWEVKHLYDRYGSYAPDAIARSLGYGNAEDEE